MLADEDGKVRYRIEGYLPPEDFIAQLALGLGRTDLDRQQFDRAAHHFEEVTKRHRGTDAAAQALYWLGVARYKGSKDPGQLRLGDSVPSFWLSRPVGLCLLLDPGSQTLKMGKASR